MIGEFLSAYVFYSLVSGHPPMSSLATAPGGFMPLQDMDGFWQIVGFAGLGTFQARWVVQWIHSERVGESQVPIAFWWLSLAGALIELAYFLRQRDPVGISGYLISGIPYTRNLVLVYRKRRLQRATIVTPTDPK